MRSSRSADTALDLVYQMGQSMDLSGTRPRAGCVIHQRPHARCSVCSPPLYFPKFQIGTGHAPTLHRNLQPSSTLVPKMPRGSSKPCLNLASIPLPASQATRDAQWPHCRHRGQGSRARSLDAERARSGPCGASISAPHVS